MWTLVWNPSWIRPDPIVCRVPGLARDKASRMVRLERAGLNPFTLLPSSRDYHSWIARKVSEACKPLMELPCKVVANLRLRDSARATTVPAQSISTVKKLMIGFRHGPANSRMTFPQWGCPTYHVR